MLKLSAKHCAEFRDFQMNQQISAFKELKFQCDTAKGIDTGWHEDKKRVELNLA